MNDVDEAFFERSLIFYRHSLQNVLNFWRKYNQFE
jgi:hypothetical protein